MVGEFQTEMVSPVSKIETTEHWNEILEIYTLTNEHCYHLSAFQIESVLNNGDF